MEKKQIQQIRRPTLVLIWTVFAFCGITAINVFREWINDQGGIGPGEANLIKYLLIVVTIVSWLSWLTFFSRIAGRYLVSAIVISMLAIFFYFFRLDVDGDLGIVRIAPRFETREFRAPKVSPDEHGISLNSGKSRDFNQFLGPERNSIISNCRLNTDWISNPPVLKWKQPIGEGWSGFVATGKYAITQEQRGDDECVSCYDIENGDLIWIHKTQTRHEDLMAMGKVGPRATPTISDGKIYAQGATGVLKCLDGKGNELWSVDLAKRLGIEMNSRKTRQSYTYSVEGSSLAWGRSGSPLIYKNLCITTGGGPINGPFRTLLAFEKDTGKEVWAGGENMIAYGSPSIAKLLGRDQITLVAESAAMGFDPLNGSVLWQTTREGSSSSNANCSQVTRVSDDRILLSKAYQLGGEMVQLSQSENKIEPTTIWKNSRVLRTKMTSPVIKDGHTFCLSDGFFECSNIDDDSLKGRRTYRKRDGFGNGQLLMVGNHLLVHTEHGKLKLVEANPNEYVELGEIETILGICWNTICLQDRYLLVRSEREAACFELSIAYDENASDRQAISASSASITSANEANLEQ